MSNGRLANCLIPPYSGVELYSNNSGSSASISINTQVISSSANSEITTTVGTSSTTLSAINNLATTGCYCRLIGYHIDSDGYYGAFTANTTTPSCPHVNRYIACDGTVTDGFTTTSVASIPFGGSEIVNPLLRYGTQSVSPCTETYSGHSAVIGIIPSPCSSNWLLLNRYTVGSENCAATTLVNPCCNSQYLSGCLAICCARACSGAINYYSLETLYGANCYEFYSSFTNLTTISASNRNLCIGYIRGCTCGTTCSCINVPLSNSCIHDCNCTACNNSIGFVCGFCSQSGCGCDSCWCCNSFGCRISPFGVHAAATDGVAVFAHWMKDPTRYLITPTNGCCLQTCSCCYNKVVDLLITSPVASSCELPIKYLSYNPNTNCVYMMVRSTKSNECGIFTVNKSALCACYGFRSCYCGYDNITCSTLETSSFYCKVADFPEIMTCSYYTSPFMCVSCIFRSGSSTWSISIYNCSTSAWDTFTTTNLVDWNSTTNSLSFYENDTSQINNTLSCVYRYCNCFMSNVNYSGMTDYKVSANNYERTGVVVSNGDKVFVNNNSNNCMSAQVWGYEG